MNFTREPIIETIITPKEGNKLVVRSSKTDAQEEYTVDAVEVVSFGQALFFRSLEKPKSFLVPVGDYEVVEVKENRVVLKNASFDRNIKIGGGREASIRREAVEKESLSETADSDNEEDEAEEDAEIAPSGGRFERHKRDRRRNRRRRAVEERDGMRSRLSENTHQSSSEVEPSAPVEKSAPTEVVSTSSIFTTLIPPPSTLISDSIKKYQKFMEPAVQETPLEPKSEEGSAPEGTPSDPLNRVVSSEAQGYYSSQTSYSSLSDWTNFIS